MKKHICDDMKSTWKIDGTGHLKCVCGDIKKFNTPPARFDGGDYEPVRDDQRLSKQYLRIYGLMKDGRWRTFNEIEDFTGDPVASISAQLRHMRKPRFGAHTVNKEYLSDGLYRYQLIVREVGTTPPPRNNRKHCKTCIC